MTYARELADSRPGWLSHLDSELMCLLLSAQRAICVTRGLLEIGVYAGKSAAILACAADDSEELVLCDPLIGTAHTPLAKKIPSLDATARWLREQTPTVDVVDLLVPSSALIGVLGNPSASLRAIHIDGDHGAAVVAADLRYASMRVTPAGGLIVVDDFRTAHTPGVAAAFWPWIDGMHGPHSVVLSEHKAYVLLGTEWEAVIAALPQSLSHGELAAIEELQRCQVIRYSKVGERSRAASPD